MQRFTLRMEVFDFMMFNDPIGLAAQRLAQRFGAEIPTGFYSHVRTWLD